MRDHLCDECHNGCLFQIHSQDSGEKTPPRPAEGTAKGESPFFISRVDVKEGNLRFVDVGGSRGGKTSHFSYLPGKIYEERRKLKQKRKQE